MQITRAGITARVHLLKLAQYVNADINGAANIVRKSKQNFRMEELCKGLLASPQRIRVS